MNFLEGKGVCDVPKNSLKRIMEQKAAECRLPSCVNLNNMGRLVKNNDDVGASNKGRGFLLTRSGQ